MEKFVTKHAANITGTLSCFDRMVFKGYLPLQWDDSMENFMKRNGLLIKDFKPFVTKHSDTLVRYAQNLAQKKNRPYSFLRKHIRKDDAARDMAQKDNIASGLICVFSCLETCPSFKLAYGAGKPRIIPSPRKCRCLYFYFMDRDAGLLHVRIQTWFPFTIQVCFNGHEWLARKLDRHAIKYQKIDNAFVAIDNPRRAQMFADRLVNQKWRRIFDVYARRVNPLMKTLLARLNYYWVCDQAEYATDIIFKDRKSLKPLYEKLSRHALLAFSAEDVLTFLGKKLHGLFAGQILNDYKKRWPGLRVKHRAKNNWIKMYDKLGSVLRIETVINRPYEFKLYRMGKRHGQWTKGWYPMNKCVANLFRYRDISLAANKRYLNALAVVDNPAETRFALRCIASPVTHNDRSYKGFNPADESDCALFAAVMRGEHLIDGFRNRHIREHLFKRSNDAVTVKRQSAAVSRLLKRLHLRKLIAKIPRSRKWRVTDKGHAVMSMALTVHHEQYQNAFHKIAS